MQETSPLQRLLLSLLPAMLLIGIGTSAVWGESGLFARHALADDLARANAALAALERENQGIVRDLKVLEVDPLAVERQVAEEIGWARPGTTIYRFESEGPISEENPR